MAAHLGGCAPPSRLTAFRWREISKMAAVRAAPARDADTATPPRRDARREPALSSSVPDVQPERDDARDDARVPLSVPPAPRGTRCTYTSETVRYDLALAGNLLLH